MKRIIRIAALGAVLAAAAPALAQQGSSKVHVGLGIGFPVSELAPLFAATGPGGLVAPQLYVPIDVTPSLRIEPQIGLFTSHDSASGDDISFKSIGTGVFYVAPLGGPVNLYAGGRLVLSFFKQENVGGGGIVTETSGTDVYIAATLGGEFWAHQRFSVGGEGQLGYTSIGDRDVSSGGVTVTQSGGSGWQTQGILFVRVFFL